MALIIARSQGWNPVRLSPLPFVHWRRRGSVVGLSNNAIDPLMRRLITDVNGMATEPSILTTGLLAHVETVRRTVFRLALILILATMAAYPFAASILHMVTRPIGTTLTMYAPLEGFLGYIKVSFAAGFLVISPLLLYEINRFLQRVCGMRAQIASLATVISAGLFMVGVGFCYFVILPITLRFLLNYGADSIAAGISVSKYLSLTLGLSAACGVMFELPLVLLILSRLGFVSVAFLTRNRRYAVLVSALATAILTPTPDAYTMSMLLVPLLGLYEISILVVRLAEYRQGV
jgi:sec-independent protein translocase protein TatC